MSCEKCNDTGRIGREIPPPPNAERNIGNGMIVVSLGGYTTELCECRKDLPPRYGKVSSWDLGGPSHTEEWSPGWWLIVNMGIRVERPISADGYPLHRTADNCYMGPSITIGVEGDQAMNTGELRDLAAFLIRMAEKADELDTPHADKPHAG